MNKDFKRRQEEVLEMIVTHYTETAEPVGSRYVARRLGLSSATIRNVMSDLEEAGYITQPHTSAGRIPTDKGYRFYIDTLMRIRKVNENIVKAIDVEYHEAMKSFEDVLEKTTSVISSLTNYVGIALYPEYEKVYLNGQSHILEQPEFRDLKKLHNILRYLEEKRAILRLLQEDFDKDGFAIHIGREMKPNDLSECSIVTRGYKVKGKRSGRLGVIGPKRMLYEKVIPTIEVLADTVTNILDSF